MREKADVGRKEKEWETKGFEGGEGIHRFRELLIGSGLSTVARQASNRRGTAMNEAASEGEGGTLVF